MARDSLARDNLARDSLAQDSLAQDSLAQDSLAQDSLAQDSLAQDSLAQDSRRPDGGVHDWSVHDWAVHDWGVHDWGVHDGRRPRSLPQSRLDFKSEFVSSRNKTPIETPNMGTPTHTSFGSRNGNISNIVPFGNSRGYDSHGIVKAPPMGRTDD